MKLARLMVKITTRGNTVYVSSKYRDSRLVVETASGLLEQLYFGHRIHSMRRGFEYEPYDVNDSNPDIKNSPLYIMVERRSGTIRSAHFETIKEYIIACALFKYLRLDMLVKKYNFSMPLAFDNDQIRHIACHAHLIENLPSDAFE